MNRLLVALRDTGSTVLVVEHEPQVIAIADHVVDMGSGAGVHGGAIVFEGPPHALLESKDSLTGRHLEERLAAAQHGDVVTLQRPRQRRSEAARTACSSIRP